MEPRIKTLGHRGASFDAPENTLAAFREALRQGADGVELDVRVCGTGELVVCHDEWLDRLAGEHLRVEKTPLSVLKRLDVGARHGAAFVGERMPTLRETLAAMPRQSIVNIEVKTERVSSLDMFSLGRKVAREIRRCEACQDLCVSSFRPVVLAGVRSFAPRLPIALLVGPFGSVDRAERNARWLRAKAIHAEQTLCTPENVARWKRMGLRVAAWTVDEPGALGRCLGAGVDALITNRPFAAKAYLARAM